MIFVVGWTTAIITMLIEDNPVFTPTNHYILTPAKHYFDTAS